LVAFYVFREGKSISTRSACNVLITLLTKYPDHSGLISQIFRTPKTTSLLYASLYANFMYNRKRSFTESIDPMQHHSYRHSFVVTFATIRCLVSAERFLHCVNLLRVIVSRCTTMAYVDKPSASITVITVIPKFVNKWRWNDDEAVADWKSICSSPMSSPFSIGSSFIPTTFFSWLWSIFHVFFDSRLEPGLRVVGGLSIPENMTIQ